MIGADRVDEMVRDATLGKNKRDSAHSPEEEALWDRLVVETAAIREAGIPEMMWEAPATDYGESLYIPDPTRRMR